MENRIVCIDLDGTLAHYDDWKGESYFGRIINGASKALAEIKEKGWLIIIFTTRTNKELIKNFLDENNLVFDFINENPYQPENAIGGKPFADVYIDDRAIQFNGNWQEIVNEIDTFEPWEKRNSMQTNNEEYSKDFLKHDFDQSYQQLRHYDSLNWDITKFSFLELLVGIAAVWAIYGFAKDSANSNTFVAINIAWIIPSVFGICYMFSLLASFLISRNRVYFAKVARYINEHRKFAFDSKPAGFKNVSKFYTSPDFPRAFDTWSTQLVCLYVIQFVSAFIFGALIYSIATLKIENEFWQYGLSLIGGLISTIINLWIYISYMKKQDTKLGMPAANI